MTNDSLTIIYITCIGHSGSTLLDLLLGSHPDVVSVGEIGRSSLIVPRDKKCTCRAPSITECPFWRQVNDVLRDEGHPAFFDLQLDSPSLETFRRDNEALFRAISCVSGSRVIVDSTKHPGRMMSLLASEELRVLPVHLTRSVHGVLHSRVEKRKRVGECSQGLIGETMVYNSQVLRTRRLLRGVPSFDLRYEDLVSDPPAALDPLMKSVGLTFTPDQLRWNETEHHNIGGNRMRRRDDVTIRPDERWRTMSWWRKACIAALTLPANMRRPASTREAITIDSE